MNKQQQLKELVRKAILPKCEDCEGTGKNELYLNKKEEIDCPTCSGKGYVEELEEGCELKVRIDDEDFEKPIEEMEMFEASFQGGYCTFVGYDHSGSYQVKNQFGDVCYLEDERIEIIEKLGKPLTLRELLLALSKSDSRKLTITTRYEDNLYIIPQEENPRWSMIIPLDIPVSEYSDELIDELIKLLS